MIATRAIALSLALMLMPASAHGRDFLYPWKAGQTLEGVSEDQQTCFAEAQATEKAVNAAEQARRRGHPAPPVPAGSQSWLAAGLDGQTAFFNGYYHCLRGRGYSIRRMPGPEYRKLKKGKDGGIAVMNAMIAAEPGHPEVPAGVVK